MKDSEEQVFGNAQDMADALGVGDKVTIPQKADEPDVDPDEPEVTDGDTEEEAPPAKTEAKADEAPKERVFTQGELDAIIADRLSREKKSSKEQSDLIAKLEAIADQPLDKFIDTYRKMAAQELANDEGISVPEAVKRVEQSAELAELRRKQAELETEQKRQAVQVTYKMAKDKYAAHAMASLVREVEKAVDELSANGAVGDFDSALYYTIGRQMIEGDLYQRMVEKVGNEVRSNIGRKKGAGVEGGNSAAHDRENDLTPAQKAYAMITGVSHKQYADQVRQIEKSRKGR